MSEFEFRLRFHLPDGDYIDHDADELLIGQDREGHRLRLKSGEHGVPIKQRSRAALIGGPYSSEEEARHAAELAKRALLIWAVTQRIGVDLGDGGLRGRLTTYGRELLEAQIGSPVRNDVHGIDVYPRQDGLKFVSMTAKLTVGKNAEAFAETVSRRFLDLLTLNEKQVVAAELYCSSFFDVSFRSRLITLVSAVEALLDPPRRSASALALVALLDKIVKEADIDEPTREAMRSSLQWLRQDSIGQTGRSLSARLLPGRVYLGKTAPRFFSFCYELRSQILHDGHPHEPSVNLLEVANACQAYVADLLLASFGTSGA